MIKLGISSCFIYPDPNRNIFRAKSLSYVENDMANFVTRKGVLPVLIPDIKDEKLLNDILREMVLSFKVVQILLQKLTVKSPLGNGKEMLIEILLS